VERRYERATADDDIDAILANIKLLDAKQEPKVYEAGAYTRPLLSST
jgi:hypothetical protein